MHSLDTLCYQSLILIPLLLFIRDFLLKFVYFKVVGLKIIHALDKFYGMNKVYFSCIRKNIIYLYLYIYVFVVFQVFQHSIKKKGRANEHWTVASIFCIRPSFYSIDICHETWMMIPFVQLVTRLLLFKFIAQRMQQGVFGLMCEEMRSL